MVEFARLERDDADVRADGVGSENNSCNHEKTCTSSSTRCPKERSRQRIGHCPSYRFGLRLRHLVLKRCGRGCDREWRGGVGKSCNARDLASLADLVEAVTTSPIGGPPLRASVIGMMTLS